ncbi:ChrR family anti-sigma-E factor [Methylopila henanensis]|uniref:ChrR family anti-sigma-E factor n=1 Tax=Methylopila henanensis TaxID=873516 RepID=A0ABW4K0F2_9HYPH
MNPTVPPDGGGGRPIDALLAGFVAGTLDPYMHALIGSHLTLSDANRGFVRALEAEAGAALDEIDAPKPLRPARDHVLAAIFAGGYYGAPRPKPRDPEIPEPLFRLVGRGVDAMPWKMKAPGIKAHVLHDEDGVEASFLSVRPGWGAPAHTHEGVEVTLVLRGAFSDTSGRYGRGDILIADQTVDHHPIADPKTGCVCFAVTEGSLKMTGPVLGLLQRMFGR